MFIVGENAVQRICQELDRYRSETVCFKLLGRKAKATGQVTDEIKLKQKARGLSFAISNALSFYSKSTESLSADIVATYYAEVWFWMAEVLADVSNNLTLEMLQEWTTNGHGLGNWIIATESFPDNVVIFFKSGGFLRQYLLQKEVKIRPHNTRVESDAHAQETLKNGTGYRLLDLIVRIPELQIPVEELLDRHSCIHNVLYDSSRNSEERKSFNEIRHPDYSWLRVFSEKIGTDVAIATSLGLPLKDMTSNPTTSRDKPSISGKFFHKSDYWQQEFMPYNSPFLEGFIWVEPLWGVPREQRIINFMCLYTWSIFARYMPAIWERIQGGDLDHFRALIGQHISVMRRLSPHIALNRLTGENVSISSPGAMIGTSVCD